MRFAARFFCLCLALFAASTRAQECKLPTTEAELLKAAEFHAEYFAKIVTDLKTLKNANAEPSLYELGKLKEAMRNCAARAAETRKGCGLVNIKATKEKLDQTEKSSLDGDGFIDVMLSASGALGMLGGLGAGMTSAFTFVHPHMFQGGYASAFSSAILSVLLLGGGYAGFYHCSFAVQVRYESLLKRNNAKFDEAFYKRLISLGLDVPTKNREVWLSSVMANGPQRAASFESWDGFQEEAKRVTLWLESLEIHKKSEGDFVVADLVKTLRLKHEKAIPQHRWFWPGRSERMRKSFETMIDIQGEIQKLETKYKFSKNMNIPLTHFFYAPREEVLHSLFDISPLDRAKRWADSQDSRFIKILESSEGQSLVDSFHPLLKLEEDGLAQITLSSQGEMEFLPTKISEGVASLKLSLNIKSLSGEKEFRIEVPIRFITKQGDLDAAIEQDSARWVSAAKTSLYKALYEHQNDLDAIRSLETGIVDSCPAVMSQINEAAVRAAASAPRRMQ